MTRIMKTKARTILAALTVLVLGNIGAKADDFGTGGNTFVLAFTTVGDPGNAADTTGDPNPAGSVGYIYRIGTYEVSEDMVTKANTVGNLEISMDSRGVNQPATGVSWNEAARFVNWLNFNGGFSLAYKFTTQPGDVGYSANENLTLWQSGDAGYDAANPYRNSNAQYFLPSTDEWYKAAYYDGGSSSYYDFATGSNSAPTEVAGGTGSGTAVYGAQGGPADITNAGGLSPYGTMGQGGNVFEWNETAASGSPTAGSSRGRRGGSWSFVDYYMRSSTRVNVGPTNESDIVGFRVASVVPEPSTMALIAFGGAGCLAWRRRKVSLRSLAI